MAARRANLPRASRGPRLQQDTCARRAADDDDHDPTADVASSSDGTRLRQPTKRGQASRRSSITRIAQNDRALADVELDQDTYGVSELRDGLFEAIFLQPLRPPSMQRLSGQAAAALPWELGKSSPLVGKDRVRRQIRELGSLLRRVATTRAGVGLLKASLAYVSAYALCLAPAASTWLGRHHYVVAVSVVLNHPARTLGAQLEGAVFTVAGTAVGLGWGALCLLLSTSATLAAGAGYGGVLAVLLASFMLAMAWARAFFARSHQAVLCAGIAVLFVTLAAANGQQPVAWSKLRGYGVCWLLGQAVSLVVNVVVFPDSGARALATTLHRSLSILQETLEATPSPQRKQRQRLAAAFVDLSEAHRDMRNAVTVSRFRPEQVERVRNTMQAVVRAFFSLESKSHLFQHLYADGPTCAAAVETEAAHALVDEHKSARLGEPACGNGQTRCRHAAGLIRTLRAAAEELLRCVKDGLQRCDAALMDASGYREALGPPQAVSPDLGPWQVRTRLAKAAYDVEESNVLGSRRPAAAASLIHDANAVQLFLLARHMREAVAKVEALADQVAALQAESDQRPRLHLPSYPIRKAVHRNNAQVRHDGGGAAVASCARTFADIARSFGSIEALEHETGSRDATEPSRDAPQATSPGPNTSPRSESTPQRIRHRMWKGLHALQGTEGRYAFRVCLATCLLSVPSFLPRSRAWWTEYEAWWAVAMSWAAMHPRAGGSLRSLATGSGAALLGAVWSGMALVAGNGNPYLLGAFAAVYMVPMLYCHTSSSHPRSGLAGCLSFTVVSLTLQAQGGGGGPSPALPALLHGLAFVVGACVPVVVNWVLWPFVARHELRFSLSSMLHFMSILYRHVVARYVYFSDGKDPTAADLRESEILEGRLREGFVRIRQLLALTRHELRLRAPFEPLPYAALSEAAERFFDHLIAVRQSALFYNPGFLRDDSPAAEKLLSHRRDAVAAVLGNLYILAGALRSQRKVPSYMPSAAAARRRLLAKTAQLETTSAPDPLRAGETWSDLYSFSYHEGLTGCVYQLEQIEMYAKMILGEQGFDDDFFSHDHHERDGCHDDQS
ncbi:uncharacterized protein UV8b_05657 [Ustilaginoidea virens]|uniref:Uncharacterized protein n=1 Tax=Ustilaginoidea virens TaxID=1159556 RepID=A0A8E5HTT6_USTVR|nr:uncharacterized protein UV8b_05657 [Ustilaginoidea virens]QUC21414.1 hypothetical protein UV8b_05657 [Ustilaginoidea virens]